MARIIVTINPDGSKTVVRVEGVSGPSCTKLTANLQRALGKTLRDEKTSEYYGESESAGELRKETA